MREEATKPGVSRAYTTRVTVTMRHLNLAQTASPNGTIHFLMYSCFHWTSILVLIDDNPRIYSKGSQGWQPPSGNARCEVHRHGGYRRLVAGNA